MRGSAESHVYSRSRRRRYSSSISVTQSCGPRSAASAARCEIEQTLEVEWLWMALHAFTRAAGPTAQPQRQPVIAYDFEAEPQSTARSRLCRDSTPMMLCGTG